MGLPASIYKDKGRSFSNRGLSSRHDSVTIVNIEGPFEPTEDSPAVMLVEGNVAGTVKIVVAEEAYDGGWHEASFPSLLGPMMGGCYIATSDSRFHEAIEALLGSRYYGAVPLHDRFETQEEYDTLSR